VGRLGLRLGSEPRVVGRLGSGVWVKCQFSNFRFKTWENVLGGEGNCSGGAGGECPRRKCPTIVLEVSRIISAFSRPWSLIFQSQRYSGVIEEGVEEQFDHLKQIGRFRRTERTESQTERSIHTCREKKQYV